MGAAVWVEKSSNGERLRESKMKTSGSGWCRFSFAEEKKSKRWVVLRRETKLAEGFGLGLFFCQEEESDLWGKKKNLRATGAAATGQG